jgi:hypothetical protein
VHTQKGKPITLTYFTEKRADVKNSGR